MRKLGVCLITLALGLGTLSACSQPASIPEDTAVRGSANARAPAPKPAAARVASRVIGIKDKTLSDGKVCEVSFVYGGREPASIFWEEPCAGVTAKMMDRRELEQLGRWERLDDVERKIVEGMPRGKVLYVGGDAPASIYPIGTTGTSYDRCDPQARDAATPFCRRVIETRADSFATERPDLSPEQRLLAERRPGDEARGLLAEVRRVGRNDVDPNSTDAQTLAAILQAQQNNEQAAAAAAAADEQNGIPATIPAEVIEAFRPMGQ